MAAVWGSRFVGVNLLRRLHRTLGCVFFFLLLGDADVAFAQENFWERVAQGSQSRQVATLRAVERVLDGKGDEFDLLLVRTALVELIGRDQGSARSVVLLFHLRRQLGLSAPRGGRSKLAQVLHLPLSHFDRALGYYELARLELDGLLSTSEAIAGGEKLSDVFPRALGHLDRALASAWESELRAEILLYRGLGLLRQHQAQRAHSDFLLASELTHDAVRRSEAHLSLALAVLAEGPQEAAQMQLELARLYQRRVRHASGLPLMNAFPMSEAERRILSLLLAEPGLAPSSKLGLPPPEEEDCLWLKSAKSAVRVPFSAVARQLESSCLASSLSDPQAPSRFDPSAASDRE